eukprot:11466976-Ditylum_brightwellii.AAC.1
MREWNDFTELPIESEFEQQFNLRHDIYTHSKKITLYVRLDTKLKFNKLKHKAEVYLYLTQKNIFLKPDKFSTKKIVSPGCLIEIHPILAKKDQENKHAMDYINKHHPDWDWVVDYML